ncbi:MAG: UDP-N-acetylglucosamine 1-carboxyvinyltransferase [Lachnospiraceae bacterium]|nr:UDP-N-acetylglucosamine 1-carboxyvinyltransferase [Lachnospiraceae bacterium]MCI8996234.1 UDP-N-acetylglucosamine 1-carboxyvinyltransferase [Lachnospiraceae bacterium]MCI9134727.1 UDP-N-acetylglucosamine 1-carboxyvinyltransferase [Lachnospiraceae bacterium]
MEQYVIKGGNPLAGEVEIGGAKNAALAILAAAIMTDETVLVENLPDVRDINVLLNAMTEIGVRVERLDRHTAKVNGGLIGDLSVEYESIKRIRASYYLLGALLGKYKRAQVPLPGGCDIGTRPIDQHLKGFRALGADVKIEHGFIIAEAEHLRGSHIYLDVVSVGATINIMMAAAMAEGGTVIENAAKEPHVVDVANFLNSMGANIKGAGTDVIRIRGVEALHQTEYSIIPDQIEAGTFMFAAAVTKGDVTVKNVIPKHLEATTAKLSEIGCEVKEFDDAVRVVCSKGLKSTNVKTLPYPGFPTDMQPQITVALALANGTSMVTESIFENRFKYVDELARMGANIRVKGNNAFIDGVSRYTGAQICTPDLRAGAALVIAGLAAEGITMIDDIHFIERGYERFEEKLQSLGAQIEKISSERELQKFKLKVSADRHFSVVVDRTPVAPKGKKPQMNSQDNQEMSRQRLEETC